MCCDSDPRDANGNRLKDSGELQRGRGDVPSMLRGPASFCQSSARPGVSRGRNEYTGSAGATSCGDCTTRAPMPFYGYRGR